MAARRRPAGVLFTAHLVESRYRWLLWLDSFALAVAVLPHGVAAAMTMLHSRAPIIVIMGVLTGCLGGLLRDVVCNEVPLVLKQGELYVSAALGGALTAVGLWQFALDSFLILAGCAAVTWALRAGSLIFGWQLPVYKSRPPRQ